MEKGICSQSLKTHIVEGDLQVVVRSPHAHGDIHLHVRTQKHKSENEHLTDWLSLFYVHLKEKCICCMLIAIC